MVNLLLPLMVPLMMALQLFFSPAAGIECYECFGQDCSTSISRKVQCYPKYMCLAVTIAMKGRTLKHHLSCASPEVCPNTGTRSFSITTSKFSVQAQATCCNSGNFCNSQNTVPPVPTLTPGPLKCPICNPYDKNCNPVQCNQLEDRCFKEKDYVGCASENNCISKDLNSLVFYLPTGKFHQIPMKCYTAGIKCYQCFDETCFNSNSSKVDCPPNNMCAVGTIQGGDAPRLQWQECADATVCPSPGDHSFSITHSKGPVVSQVSCCVSDYCNTDIPPAQIAPPPAGTRKCPKCDPGDVNCASVQCNHQEDACFTAKDTQGCASVNTCTAKKMNNRLLDVSFEGSDDHNMNCNELQCEMCTDPCTSCSQTSIVRVPPGMKCVAATIRDSVTGDIRVMKAVAPAPLCSGPGPQTFSLNPIVHFDPLESPPAQQIVQVTCCEHDLCNSDVPEFDEFAPIHPLVPCASPELAKQLHLLVSGAGMLPQANCPTNLNPPN